MMSFITIFHFGQVFDYHILIGITFAVVHRSLFSLPARLVSVIFHPVFIPLWVFAFLVFFSPNIFYGFHAEVKQWWLLMVAYITLVFPILTSLLLWRLKFIDSLYMRSTRERYAPLIASMLFYFWLFWLFHKQFEAPLLIQTWLLSVFLSTVVVFMCTIFFKISMHTAALSTTVVFAVLCTVYYVDASIYLLVSGILLCGIVGSARLYLGEHTMRQLVAGYAVGIIAVPLSFFVTQLIH